jgi:hypothetical protein
MLGIVADGKLLRTRRAAEVHAAERRLGQHVGDRSPDYANGVTTLTVTDDVGQGEGAQKRYARSQKGRDRVLRGLKKLVEDRAGQQSQS